MKRWFLPAVLLVAAGCAGAPVKEEAVTVAPGETVVELKAESFHFTPATLTIAADKSVVIRVHNEASLVPHSFVLESSVAGIIVNRPLKGGGDTLIRLAPLPAGTYTFYCDKSFMGISHRKKGMEGRLEAAPAK